MWEYVSFFKTRVPTRWRKASVHPGQGCGIHSGPKNGHPEPQALLPVGRGRAVFDRIFGMLKPSFQWRRSEGCIMERIVPSGTGAQAPGQIKKKKRKLQASSAKLQAPSATKKTQLKCINNLERNNYANRKNKNSKQPWLW